MSTLNFGNKVLINAIRRHSQRVLEDFREYNLVIESKFNSDKNKLVDSLDELNEGEKEQLTEYYAEEFYMIEEVHAKLHRQSTLISIYSFLEHSLSSLCRHLCKLHDYPVELSDFRGKGLRRAERFLEKLAGVDFQSLKFKDKWDDLKEFNKIRNCIVHTEGNTKEARGSRKLKNIINNTTGTDLKNEKYLKIERKYIDNIITTIESVLEKLYNQTLSVNT